MLLPLLLANSLLWPVKDTVWWNTPGGTVTEHRDEKSADCVLKLDGAEGSVSYEWTQAPTIGVTATKANWQLPGNRPVPVAMRVGDVLLSNGSNSAILRGVGHGNTVNFRLNQPIDAPLRAASHLDVQVTGGTLSLRLDRVRVRTLLDHVRLCRDAISR